MTSIIYRIEPELSCDFSRNQEWMAGDSPIGRVVVRPLRLVFDPGSQGAIVGITSHYAALPQLVDAWRAAGIVGFETAPMICTASEHAQRCDPHYQPPQYLELIVTGGPQDDVHHVLGEEEIRVSAKAAAIYCEHDPGTGGLFIGTEKDITGDTLPPHVREEAIRAVQQTGRDHA